MRNGEPEREEPMLQVALDYILRVLRPVISSNDYVVAHWYESFRRLPGSLGKPRKTLVLSLHRSGSPHSHKARLLLWSEGAATVTACLDWPDDPHLGGLLGDSPADGELKPWLHSVAQEFARFVLERLG